MTIFYCNSIGGVYLIGGQQVDNSLSDKVSYLKKVNGAWKTLPQKLQVPRRFFAALILPSTTEPTTRPIETTTEVFSACGTCTEEGIFPNPNDPTNGSYKVCSKLDDGSIVPSCLPCPFATFFDVDRQECFFECQVADVSLDCNRQSPTCDDGGTCWSGIRRPDPRDCHYFCICYSDMHTDYNWRDCRQPCPLDPSSYWMVFDKRANGCIVPINNGTCNV